MGVIVLQLTLMYIYDFVGLFIHVKFPFQCLLFLKFWFELKCRSSWWWIIWHNLLVVGFGCEGYLSSFGVKIGK